MHTLGEQPGNCMDAIFNAADEFAAVAEVFDDQTVVVLKVK